MPLLAVLSLVAGSVLIAASLHGFFSRFGARTAWSLAFCGLTWAFAAFSVASLAGAILASREPMNRWAYAHSLLVSLVLVVVTIDLALGGWIGLRTWA